MKQKLEYTVVREDEHRPFMQQIKFMIDDGWEPLGGVQVVKEEEAGYRGRYYQAMIRRTRKHWWRAWG